MMFPRPFRIALSQTDTAPQTYNEAGSMLRRSVADARAGGANLAVLPELALCGYGDPDRARALAMTIEEATMRVGEVSDRNGVAILAGYCEKAKDAHFNSAILVSARGECLANYRKMHLWGTYETETFAPGGPAPVVDLAPGLTAGLLICFDLDHPATAQDLVARGADIILVVSATCAPYSVVPLTQAPARAYENSAFVAFCNHAGTQAGQRFVGLSTIAAPDGSVLARARADVPDMVLADIDTVAFDDYRREHRYADQIRRDLFLAPGMIRGRI